MRDGKWQQSLAAEDLPGQTGTEFNYLNYRGKLATSARPPTHRDRASLVVDFDCSRAFELVTRRRNRGRPVQNQAEDENLGRLLSHRVAE